ncbi:MAG: FAD-dependent oxidoreductase [Bacteroidia bacterium]|nr:FAD-dependent oxidoreductase [Bacteroidia bacterium]
MKKKAEPSNIVQFNLMREPLSLQDAIKEANRCLLCKDAPCSQACPAGTDPAKFIRQIKFINYKGAARTIRKNNILGSVCAFVCPVDKLCEEKCSIVALESPINIAGLQRFAAEYGRNTGLEPLEMGTKNKGKIAVIGAGPAGMSCAAGLAIKGYDVTIFEKDKNSGGIARWNIPHFRLPDIAIDYDSKNLLRLGVKIKYNSKIASKNEVLKMLAHGYKAVFISTGLTEALELPMLYGYSNVTSSIEFLRTVKEDKNKYNLKNKNVAVIGGGSVAMDAACTSAALGANKVYIICLEHLEELPADKEEIKLARKMFIEFRAGSQVTKVLAKDKKITGLKGKEIEWKVPGKFIPENARQIQGTEFCLNIDFVIQAIGSKPGNEISLLAFGIKTVGKGIIVANDDFSTNIPGVFAGGDIVSGGATIAKAVGQGKKAAEAIVNFLA